MPWLSFIAFPFCLTNFHCVSTYLCVHIPVNLVLSTIKNRVTDRFDIRDCYLPVESNTFPCTDF